MSVVVSEGKRISVDDVVRVAVHRNALVINAGEVIRAASGKAGFIAQTGDAVALDICRAGMMCRAVSLHARKQAANKPLVDFLVRALNADVVPVISSYETSGQELVDFVSGGKYIDGVEGVGSGLVSLTLTPAQAEELRLYPFLAIGLGCLLASGSTNLLKTIDCVAALSCEAFGCSADAFEAQELSRPHRGQMHSAANMRMLLDGSKRINTCAADRKALALPLHCAPQTTGPCREVLAAAAKAMEIELNSWESNPSSSKAGQQLDHTQAMVAVRNMCTCLDMLFGESAKRTGAVIPAAMKEALLTAGQVPYEEKSTLNMNAFLHKLTSLSTALGLELKASMQVLGDVEAAELAANMAKMELDLAKTGGEKEGKEGKEGKKPENDDSGMSAEQQAKAEAKRKAKADKAAQKAAEKEKKKGAGLVLGAGAALVRAFAMTGAVLDPFQLGDKAFPTFCAQTLEALSSGGKYKPKVAKGARDFGPEQMRIREQAFTAIRRVFKRHGGVEIDTPVFELRELLTGKYGEDSKLIYDLADQGGELLSLRYDLTVPFARFLAMNSVGNIKRFHIAKVYRRDQPQPARGRYREFYQCDFDIAGSFSPMVADAEVITVATEILTDLPVGEFCIKLNHRKLLDAIFEICGVPSEKFRPICSAVDKLDKLEWAEVRKEMVEEKGLAESSADLIGTFVCHSGQPKELWAKLTEMQLFGKHVAANEAMGELKLLFDYLEAMGSLQYVQFDLSLARGLDYYTGVIYEAVIIAGNVAVGSIAAGGRYDNLVGMFSPSGVQTPCVGVSIGIERVFAIMEKKAAALNIMQATSMQVYIASIGAGLMQERMKVARLLWGANISAEYPHQDNPKFKKQLDDTLERGIPFMVVFGQDELDKGVVKLKDMRLHTEVEVPRGELAALLLAQGAGNSAGSDLQFLELLKTAEEGAEAAPADST
mmetsp:Transcript_32295/g.69556  ORF Transcript_32295/g.69556 Transcript_32295/m.69556 type:complete len:940 (-) Transcript_32295:54-2873(-)